METRKCGFLWESYGGDVAQNEAVKVVLVCVRVVGLVVQDDLFGCGVFGDEFAVEYGVVLGAVFHPFGFDFRVFVLFSALGFGG